MSPARPSDELRISDAEREQAVDALGEHYLAGRLTKEEYDERTAAAWQARTASAIKPLFRDLPSLRPQRPPTPSRVPARVPSGRSRRRGFPVLPAVALFVFLLIVTPLHMPWWAWLIFLWMWCSGTLASMLGRGRRLRH